MEDGVVVSGCQAAPSLIVTPNTRNIKLELPTRRATFKQSIDRQISPPAVPALTFLPSGPNFGLLELGSTYRLKVKIRNDSQDQQRFRYVSPNRVISPSDETPPGENTTLSFHDVSSTKVTPGLHEFIVLELRALKTGAVDFEFRVIGETEEYQVTVTAHVLARESFEALAMLRKLEGKSPLSEGVVRVGTCFAVDNSIAELDESTHTVDSEIARDPLSCIYDEDTIDDVRSFPRSIAGVYWDRATNKMSLDTTAYTAFYIDGTKSLEDVAALADGLEQRRMHAMELRGNLTARVLNEIDDKVTVPRSTFRTLALARKNNIKNTQKTL